MCHPPHKRENYGALDGLRAYAMMGIVMMHVLSNIAVKPSGNVLTERVIPWFTDFTLLFMMVSAFSMCCGYYERIKKGTITPAAFYGKRYKRVWPFFGIMVCLATVMDPSVKSLCHAYADLTLCFGLVPDPGKIEIIGVGWFLGTIFVFYMLFPFYVSLMDNRKRGWMVLMLSIGLCVVTIKTLNGDDGMFRRQNIINSAPFFIAGGMVYLYRAWLKRTVERWRCVVAVACLTLTGALFWVPGIYSHLLMTLIVFAAWLVYALGSGDVILNNRMAKYLSGISMEVYLCHMMAFRVMEKMHLENHIHQNDVLYILTLIGTIAGAIAFSHVVKYFVIPKMENGINLLSLQRLSKSK